MAVTYKVYRNGVHVGSPSAPTFTDTGLVSGTSYSYQVSAVRDGIEGPKSSAVIATPTATDAVVPGAYYINPSGSDTTGDGTESSPWASVNKFLASSPAPNDILYCRGGNYGSTGNTSLRIQGISGTSGSPITIKAYPGETPVFNGTGNNYSWFLCFQGGSSYWIIDGIHTANTYKPTGFGVITLYDGNTSDGGAHYVTIRNCEIVWRRYMTQQEHCVYPGAGANNITIENNVFLGEWVRTDVNGGCGVNWGSHYPAPVNLVVHGNVFKNLDKGVYVDDISPYGTTGSITHNTFIGCEQNIYMWRHRAVTVRDNAGTNAIGGTTYNLYDPNDSAYTTADHNFWGQSFDSNYYLLDGQSGRSAASDGKDAGALDR